MSQAAAHASNDAALTQTLKQVFFAWEKLRVLYVIVLAVITLSCLPDDVMGRLDFWLGIAVLAIGANVCFFAGPIVEVYLCWLGLRRQIVRPALFLSGTVFAGLLAFYILIIPQIAASFAG